MNAISDASAAVPPLLEDEMTNFTKNMSDRGCGANRCAWRRWFHQLSSLFGN
jgi:hypothetical protein